MVGPPRDEIEDGALTQESTKSRDQLKWNASLQFIRPDPERESSLWPGRSREKTPVLR